jgi:hypothetical protein
VTAVIERQAELIEKLRDPEFRLYSGAFYRIIVKGDDDDDDGLVMPFKPNRAQRKLMQKLWHRNVICKARQLGFSTLICILWLDTAMFSKEPIRCGIIAQDREAAESLFRGKILFAYDSLPEEMKQMFPLTKRTATEIEFAHNGSSIRVATSMRSGTIHRLHVSEFGKICAKFPDKAREVITGSIPAVPKSGILVIESTAEGREGEFYDITMRAASLQEQSVKLSAKDYRLHFFPWWEAQEYRLPAGSVAIGTAYLRYFSDVEGKISRKLDEEQRAWYTATCESDFSGDQSLMWQEYPSYLEESFMVSTEGCYFAEQLSRARKEGRIIRALPVVPVPVNTFWDLGRGDMSSVWCHQYATQQDRFIWYYENSGEDLIHYVQELQRWAQERRVVFGRHYLPHDADYKRLGKDPDTNQSIKEMLEELWPGQTFVIVPRISNIQAGIQSVRQHFNSVCMDAEQCDQGIKRLENYRKRWNKAMGCWADEPMHDDASHGSDAFRQWAQEKAAGNTFSSGTVSSSTFKRRGSAMAR